MLLLLISLPIPPRAGLDDDAKSRISARKRDGFGKALGDILLKDNLTTEKLVRNIVAQSFVDARYNVVNEEPENKTIKCNITANKLWGRHLLFWDYWYCYKYRANLRFIF